MNSALKWKLIAGFLLVFLAGGATGVFVSAATAHRFLFGPHRHGYAAQAMKNRLQWQLRLTDEQMAKWPRFRRSSRKRARSSKKFEAKPAAGCVKRSPKRTAKSRRFLRRNNNSA